MPQTKAFQGEKTGKMIEYLLIDVSPKTIWFFISLGHTYTLADYSNTMVLQYFEEHPLVWFIYAQKNASRKQKKKIIRTHTKTWNASTRHCCAYCIANRQYAYGNQWETATLLQWYYWSGLRKGLDIFTENKSSPSVAI